MNGKLWQVWEQNTCGHFCFLSAHIEFDLFKAQTLVSTVRLYSQEDSATAKTPHWDESIFYTA